MSESNTSGRAGLARLVIVSLGAAVAAVVLSKFRHRNGQSAAQTGRAASMSAARADRRNRLQALPGGRDDRPRPTKPGTEAEDLADASAESSNAKNPETTPATNPSLATRPLAAARPQQDITEDPADAPPETASTQNAPPPNDAVDESNLATSETASEAGSIIQAAVETTEIDPFAWPEPPAPPPVVPADTSLSTLVHDGSEPPFPVTPTPPTPPHADVPIDSVPNSVQTGPSETGLSETDLSEPVRSGADLAEHSGLKIGRAAPGAEHAQINGPANIAFDSTNDIATDRAEPRQTGPFYGWYLVAAVFVILCITSGIGFYNASVILSAATRELGASVGAVSGATGLFFAIGGLTGFVFSKRMESVDIRWFFVSGGLVGGAALLGLRWVTSVAELYVFFGFFGMAFGLAGLVPATTLVTRWFDRRRSVALSIASTGLSVGGIVVTPFSDWLIEERTLSGAAPFLATIWLIGVIPIALIFVRSYPADKGLRPDGDPQKALALNGGSHLDQLDTEENATGKQDVVPGLSFAKARTTRFFVALCLAYAVIFFGQVGGIAQLFNMILERTDAPTARTALAALAGSSVIFRLLGGAAVLRVPTKSFSAGLAVVQAIALILLATTNSSTGLILSAAFFGCSIGNLLMLQPLLLAEAFGVANYGRIYSFNQLFGTIGVAGGPFALGVIHDAYDYRIAFFAAAVASFVGCLAIIAAGSTSKVQVLWQQPAV